MFNEGQAHEETRAFRSVAFGADGAAGLLHDFGSDR